MERNKLATDLYNTSAILTAHAIVGFAKIYDLLQKNNDTAVIFHGGTFNVPGYQERLLQILKNNHIPDFPSLFTTNFSKNACAQGAAIAALMKLK